MAETRTSAIIAAVLQQLEARRGLLDRASDLESVVITVKINTGTTAVRSTAFSEQHVSRRTYDIEREDRDALLRGRT